MAAFQFGSSAENAVSESWNLRIEVMKQALVQKSTILFPLSHQVTPFLSFFLNTWILLKAVTLLALRTEQAKKMSKNEISSYLSDVLFTFQKDHPDVLQRIDDSNRLKLEWQQEIFEILNKKCDT